MNEINQKRAGNDDKFPVVIIGGGLAGLTAAVHLAQLGVPPVVIDSDARWTGGRLAGGDVDAFEYDGQQWSFTPDHGVHALWGGYDNMRAMLNRFTSTQLVSSGGEEWINRWGRDVRYIEAGNIVRSRWIPAPFHYLQLLFHPQIWANIIPLDFLSFPGFLFSIFWTIGMDPIKEQAPLDGLMMREYFRGWTPNLRATFTGVGQNLLAAPAESISLTAFISAMRFYTVLRNDAWQMQYFTDNSHKSVIQPLTEFICNNGGLILRGVTAQELLKDKDGDSWRVIVEDSKHGGKRTLYTQHVIVATNAPSAERLLLESSATTTKASNLIFPKAIRNVVVRIWFGKSPREGTSGGMFTGDFVPDNFFWLHRLYDEFTDWHEQTGGGAIEVHIYGTEKLLDQPDKNLLIQAVDEVQRAFPKLRGSFIYGAVRRNSRNHTVFRVPDHQSLFVDTPWENIYTCGDWVGYDTPAFWMERATITGIAAANHVLDNYELEPYHIIEPKPPSLLVKVLSAFVQGIRLIFRPIVKGLRLFLRRGKRIR